MGVIPLNSRPSSLSISTTHTRGGDPDCAVDSLKIYKYYPHTWGWSYANLRNTTVQKVLPTHVGVILGKPAEYTANYGTTHTRGGDPKDGQEIWRFTGYYPHTWGWSSFWLCNELYYKVLPTHVGVILIQISQKPLLRSTTHTRGGDPNLY